MKHTSMKKWLSFIVCIVLIAAMALTTTGCSDAKNPGDNTVTTFTDGEILGKGETSFLFTVSDPDGNEVTAEIHTDKKTVGDALLALNLIAGENGDYGLYVKTVNGVTLDYDTDGKYWAFYIDGEYGMTGVDMTDIVPGCVYMFKAE